MPLQIRIKLISMVHFKGVLIVLLLSVIQMNADEGSARLLLAKQVGLIINNSLHSLFGFVDPQ